MADNVPEWKRKRMEAESDRQKGLQDEQQRRAAVSRGEQVEVRTSEQVVDKPKAEPHVVVAAIIRQNGKPNRHFPKDLDLTFGELVKHCDDANLGGVGALLKVMQKNKRVDFRDPVLKDNSVVTLIEEYNQDINSDILAYEDIAIKLGALHQTSHQKASGW